MKRNRRNTNLNRNILLGTICFFLLTAFLGLYQLRDAFIRFQETALLELNLVKQTMETEAEEEDIQNSPVEKSKLYARGRCCCWKTKNSVMKN